MADYTEFPTIPSDGDIVSKGGRTWYYDGTKWVLFVDPVDRGDDLHRGVIPVVVNKSSENLSDGSVRDIYDTGIDMTTLPNAEA